MANQKKIKIKQVGLQKWIGLQIVNFIFWILASKFRMKIASALMWSGVVMLALWLTGCAPSKRLNRLLHNHPELAQKDTLIHRDTSIHVIPAVRFDTIFNHQNFTRDTLIITKKHLTIKSYYTDSTHYLYGECDTIRDTITKEVPIVYGKFIYRKPRDGLRWSFPLLFILIGFILNYIIKLIL